MTKPSASAPRELLLPGFFSGSDESCPHPYNSLVLMLSTEIVIHFTKIQFPVENVIYHFSNNLLGFPFFCF